MHIYYDNKSNAINKTHNKDFPVLLTLLDDNDGKLVVPLSVLVLILIYLFLEAIDLRFFGGSYGFGKLYVIAYNLFYYYSFSFYYYSSDNYATIFPLGKIVLTFLAFYNKLITNYFEPIIYFSLSSFQLQFYSKCLTSYAGIKLSIIYYNKSVYLLTSLL